MKTNILVLICLLCSCKKETYEPTIHKTTFCSCENPYKVTITGDHSVQCVSGEDTIIIYLENSTRLQEEQFIFIEKK